MKANAPKKIYIPNELLSEEWTRHIEGEDIEYTRTDVLNDAFIEKACEYIKEHLFDYWSQSVTNENKFIEGFEKYMKEE